MYGHEDAAEQVTADDDLCQLKGHGTGVPNDTSPDLDQARLQTF